MPIDFTKVPTPCYVVDQDLLIKNLKILDYVQQQTGCQILLALKGFSMFSVMPLIGQYLHGITASSLHEAMLGYEEMGKQVHIYSPAYNDKDFEDILRISDHIVFNSFSQWEKYRPQVEAVANRHISCGLRINPEYSEIATPIYDPCYTGSRLGTTLEHFADRSLDGLEGLHFHAMCEQNSDTLERIVQVVDEKFEPYIRQMKWINFGGGHHITRPDYDIERLIKSIKFIQNKYNVQVYLEPGEAIALNTGYLVSEVLDTLTNNMELAILDTSAACHMPDVLEMPYRPEVIGAGKPGEKPYTYRLGGPSCLAGDIIGDYSFDQPLKPGEKIVFCDMAHYTMVKNNTFNGVQLPSIALCSEENGLKIIREFGYEDFRNRLS